MILNTWPPIRELRNVFFVQQGLATKVVGKVINIRVLVMPVAIVRLHTRRSLNRCWPVDRLCRWCCERSLHTGKRT
jgi:hypothetical protein